LKFTIKPLSGQEPNFMKKEEEQTTHEIEEKKKKKWVLDYKKNMKVL